MNQSINNALFGINIVGYVKGEFGLGESSRAQIRSIKAAGIPHTICNIDCASHGNEDNSFEQEFTTDNPYAINLLNFNAEAMPEFLDNVGEKFLKDKYNIGYWAWELPTFPPEWEWLFQYYDEIWVPSGYCAEALALVSPIPIVKIMHSIDLPAPSLSKSEITISNRQTEETQFPQDQFTFLFMFDFHSTMARKNPLAVIEAFKRAFQMTNQDVALIIKCSNSQHYPDELALIKEAIANHPSIQLIDARLPKEIVNALFYHCDCYVSLHRAEGFGLTMAEAMYYGKPVISTGYSANIEFMNTGNSFLVQYDLVKVQQDSGSYQKGNIWAEPSIEHTAALMHYVFHNPQSAHQIGLRAAEQVQVMLSPKAIGTKIRRRVEQIMSTVSLNSFEQQAADCEANAWRKTAQDLQEELGKARLKIEELTSQIELNRTVH